MKTILTTTAALLLTAVPAQAQLLGGGGLGGNIGGSLGGTLGGMGSLEMPTRSVETVTRGAGSVAGSTEGSQSVDRKSGRVSANRNGSAQGSGSLDQTVGSPVGNLAGSGSGTAQGTGSASADAQLLGTDAVRGLGRSAVGTARGVATTARGAGSSALNAAGSASGSASGAASGMFSGAAGQLALAGSAAGQAAGTFDISRGMPVTDDDGDRIGFVTQVIADGRGQVQQLVVQTEDGPATVPAGNFTGSGSLLISAMGEGKLEKTARRQAEATETAQ